MLTFNRVSIFFFEYLLHYHIKIRSIRRKINDMMISKFIKESGVDLSDKIISFNRHAPEEYSPIKEPFSIDHISEPIHIPWFYKNGQKMGNSNIVWDSSIIDIITKDKKYKELIDSRTYMIQKYPGDLARDLEFIDDVILTDMTKTIAVIINVSYDGIDIQLNQRGREIIPEDIYDILLAWPKMLRVNDKIGYIGNIYLVYKEENGIYYYV